jgi:hypothetical protein
MPYLRKSQCFIAAIIMGLVFSCTNEHEETYRDLWIDIPLVTVDSTYTNNRQYNLVLTDSVPAYNPTLFDQYVTVHLLQGNPDIKTFDSIRVKVNFLKRKEPSIEFKITRQEYEALLN